MTENIMLIMSIMVEVIVIGAAIHRIITNDDK